MKHPVLVDILIPQSDLITKTVEVLGRDLGPTYHTEKAESQVCPPRLAAPPKGPRK